MKKMNSINQTFKLCQEHDLGISRHFLLEIARNGEIPCVKSGRSILINWEGLIKYLNTNRLESHRDTGIRKVS